MRSGTASGREKKDLNFAPTSCIINQYPPASVMELVDVTDSKSVGGDTVWVRVPPLAPKSRNNLDIAGCKPTVPRCCGFFICKISEVQKKMPDRNFFIWMDLNSVFQRIENSDGSQRPFSSQKGRPSTEKLYTKNRVPVCWYQKINRPGFFVFRHKRKRAPSPGKDGNSHGQHTAHLFCGT